MGRQSRRKRDRKPNKPDPRVGMGLALFGKLGAGGTTMLVVPRVGQLRGPLPSGYELAECHECGQAVWANASFLAHYRTRNLALRIHCMTCCPVEVKSVGERS